MVKVVADANGIALYFSRAPIPWSRDHFGSGSIPNGISWYRHLGIYAYTAAMLARFVTYSLSFSVSVTVCDDYKLSERELDFYLLPERYFFEIS